MQAQSDLEQPQQQPKKGTNASLPVLQGLQNMPPVA
jgi:hypothetical protein